MYTTKVNVNDLVIDMPLDEANVAQKMESLKTGGLVQPVTVWLQDFRIIDGFHRTEAAKRLGWTEIDCVVKDCDEETFWDARIQSARQHHKVTDERMVAWIHECWQQTEWYMEADGNEELTHQISRLLWNISKNTALFPFDSEHPFIEWLKLKAQTWQYPMYELCDLLLNTTKQGFRNTIWHVNQVAMEKSMDNKQRLEILDAVKFNELNDSRWGGRISVEDLAAYADHVASTPPKQRKTVREISQENEESEMNSRLRELQEKSNQQHAWAKSEEGKRAARQKIKNNFSVSVSALRAYVADNRADFAQLDDGYEMLMSLSAWAANKAAELFPEREQPTEIQLRRELADAYKQIQSLQKALDTRKSYRPNLPEVMAYSSTEIAKAG